HSAPRRSATARALRPAGIGKNCLLARTSSPRVLRHIAEDLGKPGKGAYVRIQTAPREPPGIFMGAIGSRRPLAARAGDAQPGTRAWLDDRRLVKVDLRRRSIGRQVALSIPIQAVDAQPVFFFVDAA